MKQLIIACIGLATLIPVNADENKFSISLGEKSVRTEFEYDMDFGDIAKVTSAASGIFSNLSYYQTPSLSYGIEFVAFTSAHSAGVYSNNSQTITGYEVIVEPNQYLSLQAQYTFLPSRIVSPIVIAGISYLKADVTGEVITETNTSRTVIESATKSEASVGLVYGVGLDINSYKNVSFILDYRIRPDIADNSADEINGSLKYQF